MCYTPSKERSQHPPIISKRQESSHLGYCPDADIWTTPAYTAQSTMRAERRHPKRPDWSVSSWRAARHSFSRKLRVSFRTTLDPIVVAARHRFDQIVQSQNQSQPSLTLAAQSYLQLLTKTDLSLRLKPVLACHSYQKDVHRKKSMSPSEQVCKNMDGITLRDDCIDV